LLRAYSAYGKREARYIDFFFKASWFYAREAAKKITMSLVLISLIFILRGKMHHEIQSASFPTPSSPERQEEFYFVLNSATPADRHV
jgi:hypothetical protein